jgi:serine/threonine protein kinase
VSLVVCVWCVSYVRVVCVFTVAIRMPERADYALKAQSLSQITKYVEREVINQSNLSHPHVVGFREVFLTKNHLAIVLEYLPGGNVLEHILNKQGHLSEDEVTPYFDTYDILKLP